MSSGWGGRKVARLTRLVLHRKGTTCHLCGYPGADSPDHNPPRQDLLEAGVLNPDALEYLFPSHLVCNQRRRRRPLTPELVRELRRRYEATLPPSQVLAEWRTTPRSSRWASPTF